MSFNAPVTVTYTFRPALPPGRALTCLCCTWMLLRFSCKTNHAVTKRRKSNVFFQAFIFNKPFRAKAAKLQFHRLFGDTKVNLKSDFPTTQILLLFLKGRQSRSPLFGCLQQSLPTSAVSLSLPLLRTKTKR